MKKLGMFLAILMAVIAPVSISSAAENYSCVLMKFTDNTRFDRIESNATLSDLVLEKLINSGKFNFVETKPINENMEYMLYNERAAEFQNAKAAMNSGNFNVLFEGAGYNENKAQSIATARLGQIITPGITSSIGKAHKAEYLIQGTIINIGTGNWLNEDMMKMAQYGQQALALLGASGASSALGPVGLLANSLESKETGIGVQADLRLIKASTGEVIWVKRVLGKNVQKQFSIMGASIGSDKLNNEMYFKAMDDASTKIAEALIADVNAGKFFTK